MPPELMGLNASAAKLSSIPKKITHFAPRHATLISPKPTPSATASFKSQRRERRRVKLLKMHESLHRRFKLYIQLEPIRPRSARFVRMRNGENKNMSENQLAPQKSQSGKDCDIGLGIWNSTPLDAYASPSATLCGGVCKRALPLSYLEIFCP